MTDFLAVALHVVSGLAVLCFGRRLFWLFVAVAGFLAVFEMVPVLLPGQPPMVVLLVAFAAGVVGAILAPMLQYAAAGLAGLAAGVYATAPLAAAFGGPAWIVLLGGIVGGVLMLLVFDGALIGLSALVGARAVVVASGLGGGVAMVLWLLLVVIGIGIHVATTPTASRHDRLEG